MKEITSAAELYDLLQELFGYSSYDENGDEPFYRYRMREIAKIKSFVAKRSLDYKTLGEAANYCYSEALAVRTLGDLWRQIGPALIEKRRLEALEKYVDIERQRSRLIDLALEKEDFELAQQLMRVELRVGMSKYVFAFAADRLGVEL